MAVANLTAPPMAAPGYGKRSAPDQAPRTRDDFAHLPIREACIAAHIDRLPDGAAIDIKTLAKQIPAYGQQAVTTALNNLSEAGHLRRFREPSGEGRTQWVSRSYFSRTARDDAWWDRFLRSDTTPEPVAAPDPGQPQQVVRPGRSAAYEVLVALGRADPRLALSAVECSALEDLAARWLALGITPPAFVRTLTAGLPDVIHAPGAFTRKRLIDKMPPEPAPSAPEPAPPLRRIMECTGCGVPGRPEALPGGLCRTCRGDVSSPEPHNAAGAEVRVRVSQLRVMARTSR